MGRIAILGSRGIPNAYGGFEWLAEKLAQHLALSGHQVLVSRSSRHPNREIAVGSVKIFNAWDPAIGTAGQFVYDLISILKARRWKADVILLLGYTSSAVWSFLLPKKTRIVQHMDGLEWKREKYLTSIQYFLKWSEYKAASSAHILIADHPEIESYLKNKYPSSRVNYIAYGEDDTSLSSLPYEPLMECDFDLVMARLEPENHIDTIISGWIKSKTNTKLVIVGSTETHYGKYLLRKYTNLKDIRFIGGVFQKEKALWLRTNCRYYLHGHSAGGTNPSLIQVLTHHRRILAHRNPFNQYIADLYHFPTFRTEEDLSGLLRKNPPEGTPLLQKEHQWSTIFEQYEKVLLSFAE